MKKNKTIVLILIFLITIIFPLKVNAEITGDMIKGAIERNPELKEKFGIEEKTTQTTQTTQQTTQQTHTSTGKTGYQINPEDYHSDGPEAADVKDMYKFGGSVAGVIQIVGTIVSVGVMMLLGIRYMMASADERAEYKERLLPYLIGAILLFGASNIIKVVFNIFN